jgi:hypothetical protein
MAVLTFTFGFFLTAHWTTYQTDRELRYEESIELKVAMSNPHQKTCDLHGEPLQKDKVKVKCGERGEVPNVEAHYPFSNTWYTGDCLMMSEKFAWILFCQMCRDTETRTHIKIDAIVNK